VKNPFVYGETVSGVHFCNRNKEIKELVADIINCQNVIYDLFFKKWIRRTW